MNCLSDPVLVDREALERVLSLFPDNLRPGHLGGFQPDVARAIQTARAALALPAQAAADAAGVQKEALTLLRAAQSALEPYMRVIPGTGEPGVLNEAAQVAQRISTYLAQEAQG